MGKLKCSECGQIFDSSLNECPNCACPASECEVSSETVHTNSGPMKTDWANKVYECGALYWNTLTKRFCQFSGRASRLEYWNFVIISFWIMLTSSGIGSILIVIPALAVGVRRFHDINRSGWWLLVPWVSFFFQFKKSDEGINEYGAPSTIKL